MMSRAVRAAEWSAFATLLEQRAHSLRADARKAGSDELAMMAILLMSVSADAAKVAAAIRGGAPPDAAPAPGSEEPTV